MQEITSESTVTDHDAQYPRVLEEMAEHFRALTPEGTKLYKTDTPMLWAVYLRFLPADVQYHTCHCCRRFIERFGSLAVIDEAGNHKSAIWPEVGFGNFYAPAMREMRAYVESSKITGVFVSDEKKWGDAVTGSWTHFNLRPAPHLLHTGRAKTAFQVEAEKLEDYKTMITALAEIKRETVLTAVNLLKTDSLYRSEKVTDIAEWLLALIDARAAVKDSRTKASLLWRAVGTAPPGWTHPRNTMIGTLLADIEAGLPYADVAAKFKAKMHPLRHLRPQAAPSAGAIQSGEKLVEKLGIARSLERRFATLDDLEKIWTPRDAHATTAAKSEGVFGHLQAKGAQPALQMSIPKQTMTWEKFSRTILPNADRMEMLVPSGRAPFSAMVTALHADAPPIIQWDSEDRRNPVTWYVYHSGSSASHWNLQAGTFVKVTSVSLRPSKWYNRDFSNDSDGAMFTLEGCKDTRMANEANGNALFPENLKSDLHEMRSVIEAYSKRARLYGFEEASACGIRFGGSVFSENRIRVYSRELVADYKLDRWD